jgi:hypothetical protein
MKTVESPQTNEQAESRESPATRRLNFKLSEPVFRALERMARSKGTTMSDVLRDALALEQWVEEERAQGGRILVERNGEVRELVLR